jgi:metacaspase-1
MKHFQELIEGLTPPFFASLMGAFLTFLFKFKKNTRQLGKWSYWCDALLESMFCVFFGTVIGFLAYLNGTSVGVYLALSSLGGAFGEKLYTRLSKRIETIELEDLTGGPLSILDIDGDEHKNNNTMNTKAKGYFLGIGLNNVNPSNYNGWDGTLKSAEKDIHDLEKVAENVGFNTVKLIGKAANLANIRHQLEELQYSLKEGDTLWIAYSGHGGQVKNASQRTLETYCFFDGQMADFEMLNWIASLPSGVRVQLTADCCHSGGMDKAMFVSSDYRPKSMPKDIQITTDTTDILRGVAHSNIELKGGQELVILAACQKTESAMDGSNNGVFTAAMLKVHSDSPTLELGDFFHQAAEHCKPVQTPRLIIRPKTSQLLSKTHFNIF